MLVGVTRDSNYGLQCNTKRCVKEVCPSVCLPYLYSLSRTVFINSMLTLTTQESTVVYVALRSTSSHR